MTRRPSPLTRVTSMLTALATVWSLGCCGFEPLIEQLFVSEAGAVMSCADGSSGDAVTVAPSAQAQAAVATMSASSQASSPDATCNCDNCQAPSPSLAMASVARALAPAVFAADVALTPSVPCAPLVPPPQGSTLRA